MVMEATTLANQMLKEIESGKQTHRKVASGLALSVSANNPRTYDRYFGCVLQVKRVKPHQTLAINRAEKLGFLTIKFEWELEKVHKACMSFIKSKSNTLSNDALHQVAVLTYSVKLSWSRSFRPSGLGYVN